MMALRFTNTKWKAQEQISGELYGLCRRRKTRRESCGVVRVCLMEERKKRNVARLLRIQISDLISESLKP
jgi:hypothetical protein